MKVDRYVADKNIGEDSEIYRDQAILDSIDKGEYEEDQDSETEASTTVGQEGRKSNRNRILCISVILVAAVGSYFLASSLMNDSNTVTVMSSNAYCQPDMGETYQPILELYISASHLNRQINAQQTSTLENAITEGYNIASGGCIDEFQRFMVGSILTNKTMIDNVADNGATKTLILEFETVISCDGCTEEESFASRYPSSYDHSRRTVRNLANEPLDAGIIMTEIEKRFQQVLPALGDITHSTIRYDSDGTAATMKIRGADGVSTMHLSICHQVYMKNLCFQFN
jgi:hypothetical protein